MSSAPAPKIVLRLALPDWARAQLEAAWPEARFVACPGDQGLEAHLPDVEALIGGMQLSPETVRAAPRLRWVQALGVGVDGFLDPVLAERGIAVANGRGVNVVQLAEHAMMLMLTFARGMPELTRRQAVADWRPSAAPHLPTLFELSGSRLCLIGYGEIGRAVAQRARAFGMEVWALRRSPSGEADAFADRILGPDGLDELVAAADHLLVVAPLTAETRGMIDAAAFARMKPGAYFYNMGRGGLVEQDALIAALRDGRIAGAGLDVVEPEPLPPDSPLWAMRNVVITGHTAGNTPRFLERTVGFIADQIGRFRRGEPLRNPINSQAGY